jgi:3-isopropylmalate/(R)-2-methylmalate dehydratase small subunit
VSAPFHTFRSAVLPLLRDDVDTDQIIPARFLKAVDRDGMGAGLFADWRYDRMGAPRPEFVLNGLLPIVLDGPALTAVQQAVATDPGTEVGVDLEGRVIELADGERLPFEVDPFSRSMLLAGTDELGYLLSFEQQIAAFDEQLAGERPSTLPS